MAYTTVRLVADGDPTPTAAEINAIQANFTAGVPALFDALGDIVAGTAADTAGKLTRGTNNSYLVGASGEATGLKWVHNSVARLSAADDVLASSNVATWDTEDFDVFGIHTAAASGFTIALAGYYFVSIAYTATASAAAAVNDYLRVSLRSGTTTLTNLHQLNMQTATTLLCGSGSTIYYLPAASNYNFYFEFGGFGGGTLTLGGAQVRVSIVRLGS